MLRSQATRGEPARLEDHDLSGAQQPAIQQHLRDLRGLARARGRGHDEPPGFQEASHEAAFDFIDWQLFRHEAVILNRIAWI